MDNKNIEKTIMPRVCVLMSTYNGKKYLISQVESIYYQKDVEVFVVIRDDGSTDNTIRILKDLIVRYPGRIKIIKGKNIGWKKSFLRLTNNTKKYGDFDYFCYSDQDDIWLSDKLISAIKMIEVNNGSNIPILYGSNLDIVDDIGNKKGQLFQNEYDYHRIESRYALGGIVYGCTFVWNNLLQNLLEDKCTKLNIPHDWWLMYVSRFKGKMIVDHNSYIQHIIHNDNAAGIDSGFINRIRKFKKVYLNKTYIKPSNCIEEYIKIYGEIDSKISHKKFIDAVLLCKRGIRYRVALLFYPEIKQMRLKEKLRLILFLLLNRV